MIEVGFEYSIIFFRMEVAACMWQKAPAEEATRQKRKTTMNNIFIYFLIEETDITMIYKWYPMQQSLS